MFSDDQILFKQFEEWELAEYKKKERKREENWKSEDILELIRNLAVCHHSFTLTEFSREFESLCGGKPNKIECFLFLDFVKIIENGDNGDEKNIIEGVANEGYILEDLKKKMKDEKMTMKIIKNCIAEANPFTPSDFVQEFNIWMKRNPQKEEIVCFLVIQRTAFCSYVSLNGKLCGVEPTKVKEYMGRIACTHPEYFPSDYAREYKMLTEQHPTKLEGLCFLRMQCEAVKEKAAACFVIISHDKSPESEYDENEDEETCEFMARLAITHHVEPFAYFISEYYDWAGQLPTREQHRRYKWMEWVANKEFNK